MQNYPRTHNRLRHVFLKRLFLKELTETKAARLISNGWFPVISNAANNRYPPFLWRMSYAGNYEECVCTCWIEWQVGT